MLLGVLFSVFALCACSAPAAESGEGGGDAGPSTESAGGAAGGGVPALEIEPLPGPQGDCGEGALFCNDAERAELTAAGQRYGRGAAWVDGDGDGWDDIWLSDSRDGTQPFPLGSVILRQEADHTFKPLDVGLDPANMLGNWAGSWGDYDNDGDPDLFLANGGFEANTTNRLYRNDLSTTGKLTDITAASGILPVPAHWWCASAADYDNDSFLDLVVTSFSDKWNDPTKNSPVHLYHNKGGGTFEEVSDAVGVRPLVGNVKNPAWIDYDRDGDLDLFLSGMHEHRFYRNDGAAGFKDVTSIIDATGVIANQWAVSVADFDQDGWDDLYFGRWDAQDYVLINGGDGTFQALGVEAGIDKVVEVDSRENTMGLAVFDLNDDGWPDVSIGTGSPQYRRLPVMFCNDRTRPVHFHRCSDDFVAGHGEAFHHGTVVSDYDHDGDSDILFNLGGARMWDAQNAGADSTFAPALYTQYPAERPKTANVHLVGTASNRSAIGARIDVVGSEAHYYAVQGNQGFQAQNSHHVTVYLGETGAAKATIRWPSGAKSEVDLKTGDRVTVVED